MNKPSGFSLSSLSVSLTKIPKTYLYAAAGAVLLGALGVVALNMLSAPPVEDFVPPVISTPTNNPGTGNPSTSNPATSTSTNPIGTVAAGSTSNPSGSDDIGGGPSRSLEVQPIPFLVTEAVKTDPNNPTKATTQALNTRPASSAVVNPFAPLSVQSTGDIGVIRNGSTPISAGPASFTARPPVARPSSFTPVKPAPPIRITQPRPLNTPSFPTRPQPSQTTLPPKNGPITIQAPTQNTKIVPKIPAAIANAKPSVRAPKPGVSGPSNSVALTNPTPGTPGLMRNVVPAKPAVVQPPVDPGTTVIPTVPTDPELDFAALTEPNILGGPIELREPGGTGTEAPSPLDSSIPRKPVIVDTVENPGQTTVVPVERIDPLNAFVTARGMSFVGVVLGPVNTAIFETKEGTIVVPLGATLPQSDVIVKTITADQVVLMQGQDTIILSRAK
jgi:hypothetical protein